MIKRIFTFLLLNTIMLHLFASPEFGFRSYIVKHKTKKNITEYELGNVPSFTSMEIQMEEGDIFYGALWDNTYYGSEYEHYAPVASLTTVHSGEAKCSMHTDDMTYEHGIMVTVPGTYVVMYDSETETFSWKAPEGADEMLVIGDMDGDGMLTVADITLLTSTILGERKVQLHKCESSVESPKTYESPSITKAGTTTINIEATKGETLSFDYLVNLSTRMYLIDSSTPSVSTDALTISIKGSTGSEEILKLSGPKITTQGTVSQKYEDTATYTFPSTGSYELTITLTRKAGSGGASITNIKVM